MMFTKGDRVTVVQRSGEWRVAEVYGGPNSEIYRLQRDGWRNREQYEALPEELSPAPEGPERDYTVGTSLMMFGRPAKILEVHPNELYTVEVEPPIYEPASRGVNEVEKRHVYYAVPRRHLDRGY